MANDDTTKKQIPVSGEDVAPTLAPAPLTKEEIRERILGKSDRKVARFSLAGLDVEWRQPSVKQVQDARDSNADDQNFMVMLLMNFTYVPGTQDKVFEDTDYDVLMDTPFDGEYRNAVEKISELIDTKVEVKVKN